MLLVVPKKVQNRINIRQHKDVHNVQPVVSHSLAIISLVLVISPAIFFFSLKHETSLLTAPPSQLPPFADNDDRKPPGAVHWWIGRVVDAIGLLLPYRPELVHEERLGGKRCLGRFVGRRRCAEHGHALAERSGIQQEIFQLVWVGLCCPSSD